MLHYILHIIVLVIFLGFIALLAYYKFSQHKSKKAFLVNENSRQLMENLQGGIVTCLVLPNNKGLKITYISDGWTKLTGYCYEEMKSLFDLNPQKLILEEDRQKVLKLYLRQIEDNSNTYSLEYRINTKQGEIKWVVDHGVVDKNKSGELENQSVLTDITLFKLREHELSYKAQVEPSTGLYNKPTANQLVTKQLEYAKDNLCALLLIDIDNFKTINDTFGHTFGDMVLIDIATRLKSIFTSDEILARIGGDEFLVFLPNIKNEDEAAQAAKDICSALRIEYNEGTDSYKLSCSVGVSCARSIKYSLMFEQADKAMYEAKQFGKNRFSLYSADKNYAYNTAQPITEPSISVKTIDKMIFDLLYSTTDFIGSVNMALSFLCNSFNLNYAYIYELSDNKLFAENTFEWVPNSESTRKPSLRPFKLKDHPSYFAQFLNNNEYYTDELSVFDEYLTNLYAKRNVKAVIHLPLLQGKAVNGIFGFGRAFANTPLSESSLSTLMYATKILSIFIAKQRAEDKLLKDSKNKAHAMDNLPVYVYVIDKKRNLLFMNKLVCEAMPHVSLGDKCYNRFMSRKDICETCPADSCSDKTASCKMVNSIGIPLLCTAQEIEWDGQAAFMVTCQDLSCIS